MDRREFLFSAASAALTPVQHSAEAVPVSVTLNTAATGPVMPDDFTGLSYESGQLYNPDFFSPRNTALVAAFRRLTTNGVLRLGGHLSNITTWEGEGQNDPKQVRGVRHGIEDYWEWPLVDPSIQANKRGIITRKAITELRGFLDAVGWRLLYCLNFASGSAARAADEAEAIASIVGDRLLAFVIGSEVDDFGEDQFFRPKGYDFDQFFSEYQAWVAAIRSGVPHARFAGPDTDGKVATWVTEYARRTRGDAVLLTSHFYGMGPASDPNMTAERLLRKTHYDLEADLAAVQVASAAAGGTPYRMDEGNSCFGGGRKDVSDAYASALWVADYMLTVACAGVVGVNLHGGGVGIYTPIETSQGKSASPRPLYFGIQFAQRFVGFHVSRCALNTKANVTAYQGTRPGHTMLALINKGEPPIRIRLPREFHNAGSLEQWQLQGPALNAQTGVRFEPAPIPHGLTQLTVDGYSASLLQIAHS